MRKFKVGDYVRLVNINPTFIQKNLVEGKVARIIRIQTGEEIGYPYVIRFINKIVGLPEGHGEVYADDEMVKLSEDEAFLYMI